MSDFTFPIPAGQAKLDQVEQALSENASDIARVLQPLGEGMVGALTQNQKDITSVVGRVKRPLGKAIRANQADLARVLGPLANQVDDAIALNRSQLGTVQSVAAEAGHRAAAQQGSGIVPTIPGFDDTTRAFRPFGEPGTPKPGVGTGPLPPIPKPPVPGTIPAPVGAIGGGFVPNPGAAPPVPPISPADCGPEWNVVAPGTAMQQCTAWFVLCPPDWAEPTVRQWLFPQYQAALAAGMSFVGPYKTEGEALDSQHKVCIDPAQTPPPAPPTPWPTPPPVPTPPPPGTPPAPKGQYWVKCCRYIESDETGDYSETVTIIQAEEKPSTDALGGGVCDVTGPYATQAEAEIARDALADLGCGPTPVAKCEVCTLPDSLKDGIPLPGTLVWCEQQETIIALLGEVGNTLVNWLLTETDDALTMMIGAAPSQPSWNNIAGKLLKYLKPALIEVRCFVRRMVDCWRQLAAVSFGCPPQALVGVMALRTFVKALRGINVGISFGVHATVHLDFQLVQIERAVDYIAEAACPSKIPSGSQAIQAWLQGQIGLEMRDCYLRNDGMDPAVWHPIITASAQHASGAEVQEYVLRQGGNEEQRVAMLEERGYQRRQDLEIAVELYRKVPELEAWLRWNLTNVLDPNMVERYGLLTDFDTFFWPQAEYGTTIKGRSKDSAARHYAASWKLPGAAAAREMLYRLRPGKAGVDVPFTDANYRDMLDFENWAPPAAQWLDAIAYRVLSEGQLTSLLEWHLIEPGAWREGMLDLGYDEASVDLLWQGTLQAYHRFRATAGHGWTIGNAVRLVRQGALDVAEVPTLLADQGFTNDEIETAIRVEQTSYVGRAMDRAAQRARMKVQAGVINAYQIGTVNAGQATSTLLSVGYAPASATAILAAVDLAVTASVANKVIQAMHHAYLRGEISLDQAATLLDQAGIQPARSRQLLAEWEIEFGTKRPMLATSHILKMVGEGLLPPDVANQRLRNLGWASPDRELVEAEVGLQLNKKSAQAVSRAQKRQPEGKLRKWYIQRIPGIDEAYIAARLRYYGYDDATITYLLESWEADRAKAEKPKPPKPVKPKPTKPVPIGTLRAWFFNREIELTDVRERLSAAGYLDEDIALFADEWQQQRDYRDEKPKPPPPA
jgi:hypothetical protein